MVESVAKVKAIGFPFIEHRERQGNRRSLPRREETVPGSILQTTLQTVHIVTVQQPPFCPLTFRFIHMRRSGAAEAADDEACATLPSTIPYRTEFENWFGANKGGGDYLQNLIDSNSDD